MTPPYARLGGVYDLSGAFAKMLHPGGIPPLLAVAGTDATEAFFGLHRAEVHPRTSLTRDQRAAARDLLRLHSYVECMQ
jgi:cytochrome b involved in lipid metabolism